METKHGLSRSRLLGCEGSAGAGRPRGRGRPRGLPLPCGARSGSLPCSRRLCWRRWSDDAFAGRDRGLNYFIHQLRQALGDTAGGPAAAVTAFLRREAETIAARSPRENALAAADYALAGDRQAAVRHLEIAAEHRHSWLLPFLAVDPRLGSLRDAPDWKPSSRK